MRILWLGPWHSDAALFERRAVNQAATHWSRGLLKGLSEHGCEIRVCTHCREQLWPMGELWPGRSSDFDSTFPVRTDGYLNFPGVRDAWLAGVYRRMVVKEVETFRPDIVFCYNLEPYHCAVADIFVKQKITWVPIILDQDDPELDSWKKLTSQTRGASGLVFLSDWGYRHCPLSPPRIHLDGGVASWQGEERFRADNRQIVYSGKFDDRYGGLDTLFAIFAAIQMPDCKFILTGKDSKDKLKSYIRHEPRAEYMGFLNEEKLHEIHQQASVFINPRPPDVRDNRMTFPSKLLQYLSYGKPVVSTWTDGLAPEYRELLLVPSAGTSQGYAELVERAILFSEDERRALYSKIQKWVEESHTWFAQTDRLIRWVNEVVRL